MPGARFEMQLSAELMERIDRWRSEQPALPSRAAAIRAWVERGLADVEQPLEKKEQHIAGI